MRIATRLTRLLGIDLPIIQAGMSWASSSAALPLAVSRAGGLGVIAAGPMRPEDLQAAIRAVRAGTDRPFAVNLPLYRQGADAIIALLIEERIPVLIASQGGPQRYLARFRAAGTICLHVVASERHAALAAEAGVDGLVAVGGEAGGHPPPDLVSTLVLTRAVARAAPRLPLVAAGGIADGAGIAAVMALGADGAQLGTRFLATPEASVHPGYKQRVLAARTADTVVVGRDLGLIRVLRNGFADALLEAERSGAAEDARREIFAGATLKQAALDGDAEGGKLEAGQSAGLVDALVPAEALVRQLAEECRAALAGLPSVEP